MVLTQRKGDKCGSIYIDIEFRKWLRDHIGEANYRQLDSNLNVERTSSHATEGKAMRLLMKKFELLKKNFSDDGRDAFLDLPHPLDNLNMQGKVDGGQITITQ